MLMSTAAKRRALLLMLKWRRVTRSRSDAWSGAIGIPEMNIAVSVWSAVRVVLFSEPISFTSLNSRVYLSEVMAGGPRGLNWCAILSMNGRTSPIHGASIGGMAGGVGRQTPGAGGSV